MLNNLRFDFYKSYKSISTWIILFCVVAFSLLSISITYFSAKDGSNMPDIVQQIGEDIEIPTNTCVVDWLTDVTSGDFLMMFVLVFAVILISNDFSFGYIKNIYGISKNKSNYVLSKILVIACFSILSILLSYAVALISNVLFIKEATFGDINQLLKYTIAKAILTISFGTFVATITIISKKGLISTLITFGYSFLFSNMIYSGINQIVKGIANVDNFDISKYTLIGNTLLLNNKSDNHQINIGILVAVIIIITAYISSSCFYKNKDL